MKAALIFLWPKYVLVVGWMNHIISCDFDFGTCPFGLGIGLNIQALKLVCCECRLHQLLMETFENSRYLLLKV